MFLKLMTPFACLAGAIYLVAAHPADAAVTIFSDYDAFATDTAPRPNSEAARDAYLAATAGLGTDHLITFEGQPVGTFAGLNLGSGVTVTGVDFNGGFQSIQMNSACFPSACGYNTTPGGMEFLQVYGGQATFSFQTPISSFGGFFTGTQVQGMKIVFTDGATYAPDIPGHFGVDFVGFTDPGKSISSVVLAIGSDIIGVDDIHFTLAGGDPTPPPPISGVPEPAAWAMMLAGFGLMGAMLRRDQRSSAASMA
jgi:hypothetical protein